jgi:Protein of unknwon function (DUF3310)
MSEHHVPEEKMGPKCICTDETDPQCPFHGVPRPKKRHPNCICLAGKYPSTDCPIHGEGRMGYQDGVGLLHRTPVTQISEDQIQDLPPVESISIDGADSTVFANQIRGRWECAHCDFVAPLGAAHFMGDHLRNVHMGGVARQTEERVNHPSHYGGAADPYEHIKVVDAWKLNYRLGNATKYICRAGRKPGADSLEDLRKALWYLQSEIDSRGQS